MPGGDGRARRPGSTGPARAGPLPTVVFFHGGGWVIGDLDTHDLTCRTLATAVRRGRGLGRLPTGARAPLPGAGRRRPGLGALGRRAPRRPRRRRRARRWPATRAGGNLSAVVAQTFRDEGVSLAGQLLIYPGTDMLSASCPRAPRTREGYFLDLRHHDLVRPALPRRTSPTGSTDPRLSPLHGELAGVAPAVVVVAQFDPLRDEGTAYAEALAAAGVPVLVEDVRRADPRLRRHGPPLRRRPDRGRADLRDVPRGAAPSLTGCGTTSGRAARGQPRSAEDTPAPEAPKRGPERLRPAGCAA